MIRFFCKLFVVLILEFVSSDSTSDLASLTKWNECDDTRKYSHHMARRAQSYWVCHVFTVI